MKAATLAQKALESTEGLEKTLGPETIHQLRLAYIAQWIYDQDEHISAQAIHKTAFDAITALVSLHNRFE